VTNILFLVIVFLLLIYLKVSSTSNDCRDALKWKLFFWHCATMKQDSVLLPTCLSPSVCFLAGVLVIAAVEFDIIIQGLLSIHIVMTYTYLNEVMYIDYSTLDRNLDFIKNITYQKSYLLLYLKYLSISNTNQK